jgi:hypothetical protein
MRRSACGSCSLRAIASCRISAAGAISWRRIRATCTEIEERLRELGAVCDELGESRA